VIKQSPLGDKEAYLRKCAFAARKKCHNIVVCPKEEASKRICQNRTVWFGKPEYPRIKQVGSSIKYATLAVTKVTLVWIVLKLKLSFISLSKSIYLM
jgi:hypothetical protein